jgi:O-antigen/teichoic acid export membrane protein
VQPDRPTSRAGQIASAGLLQVAVNAAGLTALFAVVTLLARRLDLVELGAFGLLAPLAGYLLIVRNMVAASAVRQMASAATDGERAAWFSAAVVLFGAAGLVTGGLMAAVGSGLALAVLDGDLERQGIVGALALGAITAVGCLISVHLDALRASLRQRESALNELWSVLAFLAVMVALIVAGAELWMLIGWNGALPLLSGTFCLVTVRRLRLPYRFERSAVDRARLSEMLPTTGALLAIEASNFVAYALARPIIGLFRSPATVGLFEGPLRAHNLFYAFYGSLGVTALPNVSQLAAARDDEGLRQLVLRGTRYSLAAAVPPCVALILLAGPLLEAWLGSGFEEGGTALALLVSYWLLWSGLAVNHQLLLGLGLAGDAARVMVGVGALTLGLSLALTPALGLEGPALAIAIAYTCGFPLMLRLTLARIRIGPRELARTTYLPAWAVGAALALALVALRIALPSPAPLVLVALGALGVACAWIAYAAVVLRPEERRFIREAIRGAARVGAAP